MVVMTFVFCTSDAQLVQPSLKIKTTCVEYIYGLINITSVLYNVPEVHVHGSFF